MLTMLTTLTDPIPRPGLHPIPNTVPITLEAVLLPPSGTSLPSEGSGVRVASTVRKIGLSVWSLAWRMDRAKLAGKLADERADIAKVIGGFFSSAFVHSFSVRSVLAGDWTVARGEGISFATNGLAVVVEELVRRVLLAKRKKAGQPLTAPCDAWIGRIWWTAVLMISGRNFARGWVREMAGR